MFVRTAGFKMVHKAVVFNAILRQTKQQSTCLLPQKKLELHYKIIHEPTYTQQTTMLTDKRQQRYEKTSTTAPNQLLNGDIIIHQKNHVSSKLVILLAAESGLLSLSISTIHCQNAPRHMVLPFSRGL